MTFRPATEPRPVPFPRWLVLTPNEPHEKLAVLTGKLKRRQAGNMAKTIATAAGEQVIMVEERRGASNPTLYAHGAPAATYHIVFEDGAPLADIYTLVNAGDIRRIAEDLATVVDSPVRIYNNELQPDYLDQHPTTTATPRRRNPAGAPARGEVWTTLAGGRCRVLEVAGGRVQVLHLETGSREWIGLHEFLATYRVPRTRRNPMGRKSSRRKRNPGGPGGSLYDDAVMAGLEMDSHESDLYLRDTPEARRLAALYGKTFTTFISNVDGKRWLDVPFAYLPWWRRRERNPSRSKAARSRRQLARLKTLKPRRLYRAEAAGRRARGGYLLSDFVTRQMARGDRPSGRPNPKGRKQSRRNPRRRAAYLGAGSNAFGRKEWDRLTLNEATAVLKDIAEIADDKTFSEKYGELDDGRAARDLRRRIGGAANLKSYAQSLVAGNRHLDPRTPNPKGRKSSRGKRNPGGHPPGQKWKPGDRVRMSGSEQRGTVLHWLLHQSNNGRDRWEAIVKWDGIYPPKRVAPWRLKYPDEPDAPASNPGGARVVYNRLLGGWYVVTGPHQTPLNGRFNSKAEAQAWLAGGPRRNPRGRNPREAGQVDPLTGGIIAADGWLELTRAQWNKIHRDYKGYAEDWTDFGKTYGGGTPSAMIRTPGGGVGLAPVRIIDVAGSGRKRSRNPGDYHYRGPSVDHSLLSPSGRMSKRARAAAMKREGERLFPPGTWPTAPAPTASDRRQTLLRSAANLRDLAARGMHPRKYVKEAARLEAEAAALPNPRAGKPGNARDFAVATIRAALKKRSGRAWSVTTGRGTVWGWITVDAPPNRRTWGWRLKPGTRDYPENYEEYDTGQPGGHTGPAERAELAKLLGLESVHHQGVSIPGQSDFYDEYMDRAQGRVPEKLGVPHWDNPNPRGRKSSRDEMARARRTAQMWNEFPATTATRMRIRSRTIPRTLVKLGDVHSIVYRSNKYDGKHKLHEHRFKRPLPVLTSDPDGRAAHLVGGGYRITGDGLVD